jgi:hypothetical protein
MSEFWGLAGMSPPSKDPACEVFIQWKGTNICCDFTCTCGCNAHFDGDFAHVLKCPRCGELWEMPIHVYPTQPARTDIRPLLSNDWDDE